MNITRFSATPAAPFEIYRMVEDQAGNRTSEKVGTFESEGEAQRTLRALQTQQGIDDDAEIKNSAKAG